MDIRNTLLASKKFTPENAKRFFKTQPGEYAAHDQFLGVSVPVIRKIAKQYFSLPMKEIQTLLRSPYNEERLLALLILTERYQKNIDEKQAIYDFYIKNIKYVNNWNLVDSSAHYIVGAHLSLKNKSFLITLANSKNMWERRIAIISTWYFIRQNKFTETIKISKLLLNDSEDLIHKAVGWMLREMGKRDETILINFLEKNAYQMPRTMLRYAIEKFPDKMRKKYLQMYVSGSCRKNSILAVDADV